MKIIESLGIHSEVYSPIMQDLLQLEASLKPFHCGVLSPSSVYSVVNKRTNDFSIDKRKVLVDVIRKQYEGITLPKKVNANIKKLALSNTATITTGHQLNVFSGPLFFWYKILDVINAVERLQKNDNKHHYVPVFWMASEDHDIEEINHFFLGEQKVYWDSPKGGPVGRLTTANFQRLYDELLPIWGSSKVGKELLDLFALCYLESHNLSDATRKLVDQLFGKYGLVIVDGDAPELKALFSPILKKELIGQITYNKVLQTNKALEKTIDQFTPQVNPREINLFYLSKNKRVRIVKTKDGFTTSDSEHSWEQDEIIKELDQHPERFSPNALLRPIYQEFILPNLGYVGGGGELAYWLQLKTTFQAFDVSYPLLQHRSVLLLMSEKQLKKCTKLGLPLSDLFMPKASFINKRVRHISDIDIDFSSQLRVLQDQFENLRFLAELTDKSFLGAVNAQEKKQLNGLRALEKRLLKAQRITLQDQIIRITDIQNALFPNGKLQERTAHFSNFLSDRPIATFTRDLKEVLKSCTEGLYIVQH